MTRLTTKEFEEACDEDPPVRLEKEARRCRTSEENLENLLRRRQTAPTIVEMPAYADPALLAEYRRVCAEALREFGGRGTTGTQQAILSRMARLNAKFTSTDLPQVKK